jgi:hypothetical protein
MPVPILKFLRSTINAAQTIPAKAGIHFCHGYRPSPVWSGEWAVA